MHDPEESIVCLESHLKSIQLIDFKNEENDIELLRFFSEECTDIRKTYDCLCSEIRRGIKGGFEYS
ncbi:hypothetical protein R3W88_008838 [Solanum pinnatisectum]|uniref:FBD domain-containing protein n=1 Tax=Solanum pinnatisectum TaxID=50273 RepID=A0AAV9MCT3_9SOLN|nr:hypothetical protein R3W88_008838 [Solanum pinnatisectum]